MRTCVCVVITKTCFLIHLNPVSRPLSQFFLPTSRTFTYCIMPYFMMCTALAYTVSLSVRFTVVCVFDFFRRVLKLDSTGMCVRACALGIWIFAVHVTTAARTHTRSGVARNWDKVISHVRGLFGECAAASI